MAHATNANGAVIQVEPTQELEEDNGSQELFQTEAYAIDVQVAIGFLTEEGTQWAEVIIAATLVAETVFKELVITEILLNLTQELCLIIGPSLGLPMDVGLGVVGLEPHIQP